jgi:integrase
MRKSEVYSAQADALLVMLYTGQRKSRVLKIRGDQIDPYLKQWEVPGNNIKRPVTHPFNDKAWEIIEPRLKTAGSEYLFLWRGKPLSDCRKTFRTACQMCGIEDMTIHDLRRSLGTWMLSNGASIESVSKTLGHSSIRVTEQVYAHLLASKGRSDTEKAIDAMLDGKI